MSAIPETTMLAEVGAILEEHGFEGLPACVEILVNEAMRIERSHALGATGARRRAVLPFGLGEGHP